MLTMMRLLSLTKSARSELTHKNSVRAKVEKRDIRPLLLMKYDLSRRNCSRRAISAETKLGPPRAQRGETDIQETALEHQQKRYREKLSMHDRQPNKVTEVDGEPELGDRQQRFEWFVFASTPRLRSAFNSILRCARKFRLMIENRFQ